MLPLCFMEVKLLIPYISSSSLWDKLRDKSLRPWYSDASSHLSCHNLLHYYHYIMGTLLEQEIHSIDIRSWSLMDWFFFMSWLRLFPNRKSLIFWQNIFSFNLHLLPFFKKKMQVLLINIFFIYPKNFTYLKKERKMLILAMPYSNNGLFKSMANLH